ncbi:MAG TPA: tRNA pseudouridine(38-40) synthase TruA [Planctomycetota bacterium]|nr:tRNA pseudouridine(38-40) synthase TruA [Planctomycetota bacterium]
MPRKLKLTIAYDGTSFHGWQAQRELRTVQGVLENALDSLTGTEVSIEGASRTDRGVHALGQVASFETESPIPTERFAVVLNGRLPPDVRVTRADDVPLEFHARFSAVGKHYRYRLDRSDVPSVFNARYALHVPGPLDLEAMRAAAEVLTGEHDFASFQCSSGDPRERTVRRLDAIQVEVMENEWWIDVRGGSFLYKMVRTVAGTLLEVARGRWDASRVARALEARDRREAGPTAPGHGLCLVEVYHEPLVLRRALGYVSLEDAPRLDGPSTGPAASA